MPASQPHSTVRNRADAWSADLPAKTGTKDVEQSDTGPYTSASDLCEVECVDRVKVERARRLAPSNDALFTLAEMFKALGDPTRLRILTALAHEELCVCDLATLTNVSESAVSHSLRTLRQLRLVRFRKSGKIAYYRLDDEHVGRLIAEGLIHAGEATRGSGLLAMP